MSDPDDGMVKNSGMASCETGLTGGNGGGGGEGADQAVRAVNSSLSCCGSRCQYSQ